MLILGACLFIIVLLWTLVAVLRRKPGNKKRNLGG